MYVIPWRSNRPKVGQASVGGSLFPVGALRGDLDRVFERFFSEPVGNWYTDSVTAPNFQPSLDLKENEKEIVLKLEVPGINSQEIDISVTDNVLTIQGEKREEKEEHEGNVYRSERRFGSFSRSVELPQNADIDKINATYDNGVLTVKLPKLVGEGPKKIPVISTR